jgi:hypothetical protein
MKPYPWDPHDIGITSLAVSKTNVPDGLNCYINVTIFNYGSSTETFNVKVYANTTAIATLTGISLSSKEFTMRTFKWNTGWPGFTYGNYTVWAYVEPVPEETDVNDNTFVFDLVAVSHIGDIDGDFDVDIYDAVYLLAHYGTHEGQPQYDPNCDIYDIVPPYGVINIYDAVTLLVHYGEVYAHP